MILCRPTYSVATLLGSGILRRLLLSEIEQSTQSCPSRQCKPSKLFGTAEGDSHKISLCFPPKAGTISSSNNPKMNVEGDAPLSPARHVTASHRMKLLPVEFVPTIDDVICGRGKKCYSHVGNDRFRERVHTMLALYKQARSKLDKSKVLNMVVEQVRQNSPGGGFVKQDESGRWYEVGDFLAREKTSQTFRDALHESYKSSSVAKKKRRQQEVTRTSTVDQMNKIPRSSIDIAQKIKSMSLEMKNCKFVLPARMKEFLMAFDKCMILTYFPFQQLRKTRYIHKVKPTQISWLAFSKHQGI